MMDPFYCCSLFMLSLMLTCVQMSCLFVFFVSLRLCVFASLRLFVFPFYCCSLFKLSLIMTCVQMSYTESLRALRARIQVGETFISVGLGIEMELFEDI